MTHPTVVARRFPRPARHRLPSPSDLAVERPVAGLVDDLLELAIVPSFSRLGPAIRRRLFAWSDPTPGTLTGRTVVVTGPTSGFGPRRRRTGWPSSAPGSSSSAAIQRSSKPLATTCAASTARTASRPWSPTCHRWGRSTTPSHGSRSDEPRIDVLIDNAGAMTTTRTTTRTVSRRRSRRWSSAPFALVAGLFPTLRATPGSRVIAVTSGGQFAQALDLDDLQWTATPFDGTRAYARAKRAQVFLVREWTRRLPRGAVTFVAMHPGWADTPGSGGIAPRLPPPDATAPAHAAEGRTRPCGWRPLRVGRSGPVGSISTGVRARSTVSPGPASLPPTAADCGTRSSTSPRSQTRCPLPGGPPHDPPARDRRDGPAHRAGLRLHRRLRQQPVWDPGTASTPRLDDGPVGVGSTYELDVRMGGRTTPDDVPDHRPRARPTASC